jgi:hypothetical protein
MPFGQQPSYLFRDNDGIYGDEVGRFVVGTGITEVKTAHRCPWQNPFVERYGGTLRRELLDHVVVINEEHLKRLLKEFIEGYYHRARPHQGLHGDTPVPSAKPEPVADVSRFGFNSRGRRFTSPLHPRGRLISCSTERPQNKRKTSHRDHHWNHSKRDCVFWRRARLTKRHLVTQHSRACAQSPSCYHPERTPKISLH